MPDAFPDLGALPFRRRRDAGDVLRETVGFLRATARELGRAYLAVVAPVALASGLAAGLYLAQVGDAFLDPAALEADPSAILTPAYWGVVLFGLLGSAVSVAAAAGYVRLYRAGHAGDVTAAALWDETRALLLPMLALALAYSIGLGATTALWSVPVVGPLAWLALAVWSVPYVAIAMAARALDAETLGEAWHRSRALVAGAWWVTFRSLLLVAVMFYLAVIVAVVPLLIVASALGAGPLALAPLQVVVFAGYLLPYMAAFMVHGSLSARAAAAADDPRRSAA
ncbi:hypothetical protein [Rubrivirga sp. IMCC45206]|uniref:hypothetical protein n=1 Tax=Rubrivirga sp. IMCC45206 TaxID=3391614 RepID=UPI00398FB282